MAPEEHTGAFAHLVLHFLFLIQDKSKENNENQTMHTPNLIPTLAETHLTRLCPSPQSVSAQEYPFTFTECYQRYHLTLTLKRAAI